MIADGPAESGHHGRQRSPSLGILKAWEAMRVVSPETCRPFSKDRRGMILGEGAAMFDPGTAGGGAGARVAKIHAEIVGFGMSADACHHYATVHRGAARAMRAALRSAGWRRNRLGTSTRTAPGRWPTTRRKRRPSARFSGACGPAGRQLHEIHARPRAGRGSRTGGLATHRVAHMACSRPPRISTGRDPECDLDLIPNVRRATTGGIRALELLRLRRVKCCDRLPRRAALASAQFLAICRGGFQRWW